MGRDPANILIGPSISALFKPTLQFPDQAVCFRKKSEWPANASHIFRREVRFYVLYLDFLDDGMELTLI